MISIYATHKTPRLEYVLDFCFGSKGEEWQIISVLQKWTHVNEFRINYSNDDVPADLTIRPHPLLFSNAINPDVELTYENEQLSIDAVEDELSVIFYLLTCQSEYGDNDRDEHDRLKAKNHPLVKLGLNNRPIADELVVSVWDKIGLDYSQILKRYQCVPSFDIDIAWAYKNRGLIRGMAAFLKSKHKKERLKVILGKQKDPYDTYDTIDEIALTLERIICFALLGDWSKYDKNIHWKNRKLGSLIRGLNATGGMGIHPSYNTYLDPAKIRDEISRLESIVGHEVTKSRQHFLRLRLPESYRLLIQCGIRRDYSMGFADNLGFRAGTSFPYLWFDLEKNEQTELLVFPFAYMDSALKDYLKLDPEKAKENIRELILHTRKVGGVFMFIWHNSSINDRDEWRGWKEVLDFTVEYGQ